MAVSILFAFGFSVRHQVDCHIVLGLLRAYASYYFPALLADEPDKLRFCLYHFITFYYVVSFHLHAPLIKLAI